MNQTRACPASEVHPNLQSALADLASKYGLGDPIAEAVVACATTLERAPGFFGKLFSGAGVKEQHGAVLLTRSALLWATEEGTGAIANGGRLREIELRPPLDPSRVGLHVYGLLFRGAAERASAWVPLAAGEATEELRRAVEAATRR